MRADLDVYIYYPAAKVADMYTKLNASRSYVYAVARACDRNQISRRVSNDPCVALTNPLGLPDFCNDITKMKLIANIF